MPVNIGDALKSQKKGLKLDVTRICYVRAYCDTCRQNGREVVYG